MALRRAHLVAEAADQAGLGLVGPLGGFLGRASWSSYDGVHRRRGARAPATGDPSSRNTVTHGLADDPAGRPGAGRSARRASRQSLAASPPAVLLPGLRVAAGTQKILMGLNRARGTRTWSRPPVQVADSELQVCDDHGLGHIGDYNGLLLQLVGILRRSCTPCRGRPCAP